MKPTRAEFLKRALLFAGTPYVWGSRDAAVGLDCSGLVAAALFETSLQSIDWRQWWTDRMWNDLEATPLPRPGDLVFYGGTGTDVQHVTVLVAPEGTEGLPNGLVVGACGGNSSCTTADAAKRIGACVMPKVSVRYRPDMRGYRTMDSVLREGPGAP